MAKTAIFCPKCFTEAQREEEQVNPSVWTRWKCGNDRCCLRFSVLGKGLPWPSVNGDVTQQRDTALKALRQLGVTVREISKVVNMSENYVGQITKVSL